MEKANIGFTLEEHETIGAALISLKDFPDLMTISQSGLNDGEWLQLKNHLEGFGGTITKVTVDGSITVHDTRPTIDKITNHLKKKQK
ncbi:hypothetical protein [Legionella sp. 227]|uniref:hypothetical protein n=1 Tax=Legionella sp. 227 TaxID=3367288 RepID=UPI00370D87B9